MVKNQGFWVFVISLRNHVARKASNTRQVGLAWPLHTTMGSLHSGQVSVQPGAMILCRKAAPCDSFHGKNMQEYWSPAGARCRDQAEVGIPWHDPRQSFVLERAPSDSEATQAGALLQARSSDFVRPDGNGKRTFSDEMPHGQTSHNHKQIQHVSNTSVQ